MAASAGLDAMIERARTREQQRDALVWAWLAGAMMVMVLIVLAQWLTTGAG